MVRPSVILSVHYRNHFPLSNFKTKHIFGILVERVTFLKPFGAPQAPLKGALQAPLRGAPETPESWGADGTPICLSSFLSPPKAAGAPLAP